MRLFFILAISFNLVAESFIDYFNDKILETGEIWKHLVENGVFEVSGRDDEIRPSFVHLQGVIENLLSLELGNKVKSLVGIIHTPMPATPLCIRDEKERRVIVRDFLRRGGSLYIVYPKEGITKRTLQEQAIYREELLNYPGRLFDTPLDCSFIPNEWIGATYIFEDQEGNLFAFAIKMSQANDPKDIATCALWFGPLENPLIRDRVEGVLKFFNPFCNWSEK